MSEKKEHYCGICEIAFDTRKAREEHEKKYHSPQSGPTSNAGQSSDAEKPRKGRTFTRSHKE